MIKRRGPSGRAVVTFTLDVRVGARHAAICGDWNGWSADRDIMVRAGDGFELTLELEAGQSYRFRYLLDGERWENDWAADAYVPNAFGGDDSVVDLTALAEAVPAATKATAAKKAAKKAAAPAKKAPAAKKAVKKAAKKPSE
jgi:1,4-alpha-glucan branching enzyme